VDGLDLADRRVLPVHSPLLHRHVGLEYYSPGGGPRHGILGLDTTRGDRLFISLLSTAYIMLAWLGFFGAPLYAPLVIAILIAIAVFLWV
jgi:predicted small integral membrane protein